MSSTHVDAAAELIISDPVTFASLPLLLACCVFLALPVKARGRASCVCRAWRDALAEPALWTRLDLAGGRLAQGQSLGAVLRGASGRAHGLLSQLDVSPRGVALNDLLPVLTANAGSLRELHLDTVCPHDLIRGDRFPTVEAVVAAAPLLQVLTVGAIHCAWEFAPRMLRAEPPFATLQMRGLLAVHFEILDDVEDAMEDFRPFADALADAALQPALRRLHVWEADTSLPQLLGALADAVVARRLPELSLANCTPPAAAPLARLLANGSLAVFHLHPGDPGETREDHITMPQFDVAGAALVANALRVNTTLTTLRLRATDLCVDVRVACALLGALVGHRSLRQLYISGEHTAAEGCGAFGAALAALIAADAPALHVFDCSDNALGDAGMAPIVEALALNRHLRELNASRNGISEAFRRERLLPAVRANTSLRSFQCF